MSGECDQCGPENQRKCLRFQMGQGPGKNCIKIPARENPPTITVDQKNTIREIPPAGVGYNLWQRIKPRG